MGKCSRRTFDKPYLTMANLSLSQILCTSSIPNLVKLLSSGSCDQIVLIDAMGLQSVITVGQNHNATNVVFLANALRGKISANYAEDQAYVRMKEEKLNLKVPVVEVFVCISDKRENA